jgi:anti-sigma-K factor RskA
MNSRKQALDPQATYQEPRFLLEDASRSDEEKTKLLLDWRQDLLELQTAGEENMPNQSGTSNVASRLQAVTDALITLGYKFG